MRELIEGHVRSSYPRVQISQKKVEQEAFSFTKCTSNRYDHDISVLNIVLKDDSSQVLFG